ncbi:sulfatase family protein [Calycomorphotria hydatis]|uniref:Arylsulfatase n=1 Tax=Calycomorphotria hydatis TaxID=2528027 RepID=A0A517T7B6_9PLAN|nr:arylsulfatase [Calycomorphotria hydatis]QDT64266.1 Arylsulfatase [Calycomorphotria hydatis]
MIIDRLGLSLLLLATFSTTSFAASDATRPNVVIIYGDDVGYGDVGAYGSEKIPTPNIDRLAEQGLVFTDGHCPASTCSASRFTMLTGILAHRRNIRILGPESALPIKENEFTLPRVFQNAGYTTAVVGKWHLGLGAEGVKNDWNSAVKPGPLEIGFDYSFLLPNTNDRVPCVYLENHHVVDLDPNDPISLGKQLDPRSTVYPDARKNPEAMTYYKSTHGHNQTVINGVGRIGVMFGGKDALWNDETMADVFIERTTEWLTNHRRTNPDQPFFLYFASQDIHVPRMPHPRFQGKTSLGYRGDAMVQLDWTTGQLMKLLEDQGVAENTMIIFSSDNGPVYNDGYDDGTTVLTSTEEVDRGHDGSGPYRGGKYQIYEGGTRVPFIVSWPARIKPGRSDALVTHTDFIRSFANLLDVSVPADAAPDSQDAMAALLGDDSNGNQFLVEEARGIALREGPWKLILDKTNKKQKAAREPYAGVALYNLNDDIGEQHNIADQHPDRVRRMSELLTQIKEGAGVADTIRKYTQASNQ